MQVSSDVGENKRTLSGQVEVWLFNKQLPHLYDPTVSHSYLKAINLLLCHYLLTYAFSFYTVIYLRKKMFYSLLFNSCSVKYLHGITTKSITTTIMGLFPKAELRLSQALLHNRGKYWARTDWPLKYW